MLKPTMNAASDLPISAKGDYATCSPELPDEKPFDMLRAEEDPHVPPTRFHAKPLPRLGCGGPSHHDGIKTPETGMILILRRIPSSFNFGKLKVRNIYRKC